MIYACSDIHGNYEVYMKVMDKLSENDKLYIIGDIIDRGTDGIKVLLDIMNRDNVEFLVGNHEWMMLMSVLSDWDESIVDTWLLPNNMGAVTMKSLLELSDEDATKIISYLLNCKVATRIMENDKMYNLIHGYYDKRVELIRHKTLVEILEIDNGHIGEGTIAFDLLWNSPLKKDRINDYHDDEYYIHGHVPVLKVSKSLEPFKIRSMIFIDGGLQYGGGLILYNITNDSYEVIK